MDEHLDWVGQYLVMKRASIEPNFHTLYINFMDTMASTPIRKMVLRETYRNIKVCVHVHQGLPGKRGGVWKIVN